MYLSVLSLPSHFKHWALLLPGWLHLSHLLALHPCFTHPSSPAPLAQQAQLGPSFLYSLYRNCSHRAVLYSSLKKSWLSLCTQVFPYWKSSSALSIPPLSLTRVFWSICNRQNYKRYSTDTAQRGKGKKYIKINFKKPLTLSWFFFPILSSALPAVNHYKVRILLHSFHIVFHSLAIFYVNFSISSQ